MAGTLHAGGLRRLLRDKTRPSRADDFPNWRPTELTATIENTSSIPITIIAMPTRFNAVTPTDRRRKRGLRAEFVMAMF